MKNHLTTDQLVDQLYGLVSGEYFSGEHLNSCAECSARLEELRERRAMAAESVPVAHDFLAAQRRNIYARMGEHPQTRMKWVPALAAACLVIAGVSTWRPSTQVAKPEILTERDAQLFSDVYSMEQSMEPLAAKPIHAIFEQDQ
jgi:hypothetical protein